MGRSHHQPFNRKPRADFQPEMVIWKQRVEERLRAAFISYARALPSRSADVRRGVAILREFTLRRSSKRIRAYLVKVGYEATGRRAPDCILDVAAAVELVHSYLLIHDDIIDRDEQRRGGPTVHAAIRQTLPARINERDHAANSLGLLIGDLAVNWAFRLIVESHCTPTQQLKAIQTITSMLDTTFGGQYLDVVPVKRSLLTFEHVRTIAERKTAAYTFVGPLLIGARLAGASRSIQQSLEHYGRYTGVAFQFIDDVDDIRTARIKKCISNDCQEGKITVVVVAARQQLAAPERRILERLVLKERRNDREARQLAHLITASGAEEMIDRFAKRLVVQGQAAIARNPSMSQHTKSVLNSLSQHIIHA